MWTVYYFPRAAEDLLSQIQKNYQKPQEELEVLKEAASSLLSRHNSKVQAAEELLREAERKTQESGHLLLIVRANLREFNVSLTSSLPIRAGTQFSHVNDTSLSFLKNEPRRLTSAHSVRHRGSEADLLLWSILRGDFCYRIKSCVFKKNKTWRQC